MLTGAIHKFSVRRNREHRFHGLVDFALDVAGCPLHFFEDIETSVVEPVMSVGGFRCDVGPDFPAHKAHVFFVVIPAEVGAFNVDVTSASVIGNLLWL